MTSLRSSGTRTVGALAIFFAVVLALYLASPVIQSGDGRLVVYEAHSELHQGNTDLSEFGAIVQGFPCYRVGARTISRYPWGTSVATAPVLLAVETGGRLVGHDPAASLTAHPPRNLEKALASVLAALGCVALVLLGLVSTGRLAPSLLLGGAFAVGTSMWSTVSRGLWQHGPLILLLTSALILLVRARDRGSWVWAGAAGLPLGAAFAVRPTASISIAVVGVYLLARDRRATLLYAGCLVATIGPTLLYNRHVYGSWLNPFYFHNGDGFISGGLRDSFPTGLAGTMVSPARGLLVYSPFLVLAVAGLWVSRRSALSWAAAAAFALTWVTTANTHDWPGGWSFGPRLLSDTLPWLAVLMLPVLDAVCRAPRAWSRATAAAAAVLVLGLAWAVFVNGRGALSWSTQMWNPKPVGASVDGQEHRFWDWSDPQFLRADGSTLKDVYPYDTPPDIPPGTQCVAG